MSLLLNIFEDLIYESYRLSSLLKIFPTTQHYALRWKEILSSLKLSFKGQIGFIIKYLYMNFNYPWNYILFFCFIELKLNLTHLFMKKYIYMYMCVYTYSLHIISVVIIIILLFCYQNVANAFKI